MIMEVEMKDTAKDEKTNGVPKEVEKELSLAPEEPKLAKAEDLTITKQDIDNLKVIFDWALTVSVRDRQKLVNVITFEDLFVKKLENILKPKK